jgi:ferredoxin-type protein NapH
VVSKGWLGAHRWLLWRRLSQLSVFGLFLLGPWFGLWIVEGNLASSLTLGLLPLTDPYLLLQSLFAGHLLEMTAIVGALIVSGFYLLVGGRAYCAWVCPLNPVTDVAAWLRERLGIKGGMQISRRARYWLLGVTLLLALATGTMAWELVNPVSILQRGIIFGMGFAWLVVVAVFVFDLLISKRGWCGHLCPVGAFWSLLGAVSVVRVSAARRAQCNDCMDCFVVCPEPQVITPALRGAGRGASPVIESGNCTNCARCIDICSKNVFEVATRFNGEVAGAGTTSGGVKHA